KRAYERPRVPRSCPVPGTPLTQSRRCTMANAVHKSEPRDTLGVIAAQYYALDGPRDTTRDVELRKVTEAVRAATPLLPKGLKDGDRIPEGTTVFVPTLRGLNRAVFTDHALLLSRLKAAGFDHARKLLRHLPDQIV